MKFKLGIYGSAAGDMEAAMPKALELGKVLQGHADKFILITGACPGLPYAVISSAAPSGVEIWGFSAEFDIEGLRAVEPDEDQSIYTKLVYVPRDFQLAGSDRARKKYRNLISTASCDAAIIISGRWGTLNEFTNVIDFQKPVGVFTGTGGVADELISLSEKISKPGQGALIFDDDPKRLVDEILESLSTTTKL
jgi:predicted Rossmann-fold nucleotide-binding protein